MMPTSGREHYLAEFARTAYSLPGAQLPWLARRREQALQRFADTGFPTTRQEDWKYTNVSALERRAFKLADAGGEDAAARALETAALSGTGNTLVFVNGRYSQRLSRSGSLPAGTVISNLTSALDTHGELLESCMREQSAAPAFTALNTALCSDGVLVSIPAQVRVEAPVHLVFLAGDADSMSHYRNVIHLAAGASAAVVEHYVGLDDVAYFTNAVTEIVVADHASLAHYKLQQESAKAFHIAGIRARQAAGSALTSYSFSLGAGLARNDIHSVLEGEGAQVHMQGLYMAGGRQHVDHHTRIDHAKPRCLSRELYKGVLDGAARAVFNGKVVVHKDAQHTDAQQTNKNLLLSEHAEIDTKPELEIYADDVKCAHGATVGQLDAQQLFY